MHATIQQMIDHLRAQQPMMVKQLHAFCEINSGSYHLDGLQRMKSALETAFASYADDMIHHAFEAISTIDMTGKETKQPISDALLIRKRPHLTRRILLVGHMDTVYGAHHPFQAYQYLDKHTLNGPGVADMKGGLVVMLYALLAFEQTPFAEQLGIDVLINADEEIGSPASRILIEDLAPNYQAGLVYEPAMDKRGCLAKNRKGNGKFTLLAKGKSAHAGRAFAEGKNAICYLAEIVLAIDQLNGKREGITINVGKITGGDALNMVPDTAVAKLDVRISTSEDTQYVKDAFNTILKQYKRPGYSVELQGSFDRPVKKVQPGTEVLFKRIQDIGKVLGISIEWKDSGGCCDGNNLAQYGLPVIDTLGVRGGNLHSPEEFILVDSLSERALLSALLFVDLAQGGLETLQNH